MRQNEKAIMDEMNPQARNYLLRWRRITCAAAITGILMSWVSVQIQAVQLLQQDKDVLFTGVSFGLMYFATALAQVAFPFLLRKTSRLVTMLVLPVLCVVCALGALARSPDKIPAWLTAFGFAYGMTSSFLLRDYLAVTDLYKEETRRSLLLTPAIGIALFLAGLTTFWLIKNAADTLAVVYFSTSCAVFATGICLKSFNGDPIPEAESPDKLYTPLQQRSRRDRVELGLLFLSFAVSGALMAFFFTVEHDQMAFRLIPALLLILVIIPLQFAERRMLWLLLIGCLLMLCFGIAALWDMLFSINAWGICLGLLLVLHYAEEQILPKKLPAQASVLLAEVNTAMLLGIVLSAVSLSLV